MSHKEQTGARFLPRCQFLQTSHAETPRLQFRPLDEKMRAVCESSPSGDSLRLAVLAALNIADELFRHRDVTDLRDGQLADRAQELERLLDRVLMT